MAGLLTIFAEFGRVILRERNQGRACACAAETGNDWGGQQLRPYAPLKSGNCIAWRIMPVVMEAAAPGTTKSEIARRLQVGRTSIRRILATSFSQI